VVDNQNPVAKDLVFYPQYLREIGYQTAMIGKWHMGGDYDEPQRGFDYWVSFKGQGFYLPEKKWPQCEWQTCGTKGLYNRRINEYALDFLKNRKKNKPFMLYLSHKGVHADFVPADRDKDMFKELSFNPPLTMDAGTHQGHQCGCKISETHGMELSILIIANWILVNITNVTLKRCTVWMNQWKYIGLFKKTGLA
jgi:N-acetylglucosamine-6-sulfatase